MPVSRSPEFIARTDRALRAALPGLRIVAYGHVGDGNLHDNVSKPSGSDDDHFTSHAHELARVIYDAVRESDGSISAEHGLGQAKRDIAVEYKDPVELAMMRDIKRMYDPDGLMNPGKVLSV